MTNYAAITLALLCVASFLYASRELISGGQAADATKSFLRRKLMEQRSLQMSPNDPRTVELKPDYAQGSSGGYGSSSMGNFGSQVLQAETGGQQMMQGMMPDNGMNAGMTGTMGSSGMTGSMGGMAADSSMMASSSTGSYGGGMTTPGMAGGDMNSGMTSGGMSSEMTNTGTNDGSMMGNPYSMDSSTGGQMMTGGLSSGSDSMNGGMMDQGMMQGMMQGGTLSMNQGTTQDGMDQGQLTGDMTGGMSTGMEQGQLASGEMTGGMSTGMEGMSSGTMEGSVDQIAGQMSSGFTSGTMGTDMAGMSSGSMQEQMSGGTTGMTPGSTSGMSGYGASSMQGSDGMTQDGMQAQSTSLSADSSQQGRKLEFVHVTKTGGSAVEAAGAKSGLQWGACHFRTIKYLGCLNDPDWNPIETWRVDRMPAGLRYKGEPWHVPPHWTDPNQYEGSDTFMIVRNPYERLVSEYYCSAFGYQGNDADDPAVFNNWISGNLTTISEEFLYGHMLPMHYYVYDEFGNKVIDHILRYESIKPDFDALMEMYGLETRMPEHTDASSHHQPGTKGKKKFSVNDISPENIKKINEVYARDFEYFGYVTIAVTDSMSVGQGGTLAPLSEGSESYGTMDAGSTQMGATSSMMDPNGMSSEEGLSSNSMMSAYGTPQMPQDGSMMDQQQHGDSTNPMGSQDSMMNQNGMSSQDGSSGGGSMMSAYGTPQMTQEGSTMGDQQQGDLSGGGSMMTSYGSPQMTQEGSMMGGQQQGGLSSGGSMTTSYGSPQMTQDGSMMGDQQQMMGDGMTTGMSSGGSEQIPQQLMTLTGTVPTTGGSMGQQMMSQDGSSLTGMASGGSMDQQQMMGQDGSSAMMGGMGMASNSMGSMGDNSAMMAAQPMTGSSGAMQDTSMMGGMQASGGMMPSMDQQQGYGNNMDQMASSFGSSQSSSYGN